MPFALCYFFSKRNSKLVYSLFNVSKPAIAKEKNNRIKRHFFNNENLTCIKKKKCLAFFNTKSSNNFLDFYQLQKRAQKSVFT
jgi:hypothetical protein